MGSGFAVIIFIWYNCRQDTKAPCVLWCPRPETGIRRFPKVVYRVKLSEVTDQGVALQMGVKDVGKSPHNSEAQMH